MGKLTALKIKNAKPKQKPYRLSDGEGLVLEVTPQGSKRWRFRYTFDGKEKLISMGIYPEVDLKTARDRRYLARKQVADGMDPSEIRQAQKASRGDEFSFETIAREWHMRNKAKWSKHYGEQILVRLEKDVFPWLGGRHVDDINPPDVLKCLRRIENRGATELAHRVKWYCGQAFRYGIATGNATRDPTQDLRGALGARKPEKMAAITEPRKAGELLRAIDDYEGSFVVKSALKLAPLVFVRPGELRQAEWSEVDLERAEWRIPAAKMKSREEHVVPLSTQAIRIIEDLRPYTGEGGAAKYLFHSPRTRKRPMSNNGILSALRRMGYTKEEMTGHGFRAMASTMLNELGWRPDLIEKQLAHKELNAVRASYNRASYLDERRKMMQAWSDYLDELKKGGKVKARGLFFRQSEAKRTAQLDTQWLRGSP